MAANDSTRAGVSVDDTHWPLVIIRWPSQPSDASIDRHFEAVEALLERDEPFAAIVDVDSLRRQNWAQRYRAAKQLARLTPKMQRRIVAVAHVADNWLARAVLTTVFAMTPPPFATRDFREFEVARAWIYRQLRAAAVLPDVLPDEADTAGSR